MARNVSIISINAPKERVWEVLTKPEWVKLWQYGSNLITDWEVGGDIRFRAEWEGKVFEQWGKVLEVQLYELVRYSLFAPRPELEDMPENYFIMSYVLRSVGTWTRLEIIQEDNRPNAIQQAIQGEENPILIALKKIAEEV